MRRCADMKRREQGDFLRDASSGCDDQPLPLDWDVHGGANEVLQFVIEAVDPNWTMHRSLRRGNQPLDDPAKDRRGENNDRAHTSLSIRLAIKIGRGGFRI